MVVVGTQPRPWNICRVTFRQRYQENSLHHNPIWCRNYSGTKAPSPAPSSGDVTHLREHAPNPYAPAMHFGHSNKKTPTPPRDILRDFQGPGQSQGQSQGHIDELSRRFQFGANRKKTPTPPCSPNKCANRHVTYEINDIAAKLSGVHARRSGTPVLPPRKRPSHPPRPPIHQAFPPSIVRPPIGASVSHAGLPRPREQDQDSPRGLDYHTGLPNNAIKRPADAVPEDLTCTKSTGSYNMDECEYSHLYFINILLVQIFWVTSLSLSVDNRSISEPHPFHSV